MKIPAGNKKKGVFNRFIKVDEARAILRWFYEMGRDRDFVLFMLQVGLGRRICETVAIHIKDIKPDYSHINFRLAKTDIIKEVYVPRQIRLILCRYIKDNHKQIYASGGWLFYSFNHQCKVGHISGAMAHLIIREAVRGCEIDDVIPNVTSKVGKPIYRIGTHSFRRLSTTKLLRQTGGDIRFVAKYRGDLKLDTVLTYDGYDEFQEQEERELEEYFNSFIEPQNTVTDTTLVKTIVRKEIKKILSHLG